MRRVESLRTRSPSQAGRWPVCGSARGGCVIESTRGEDDDRSVRQEASEVKKRCRTPVQTCTSARMLSAQMCHHGQLEDLTGNCCGVSVHARIMPGWDWPIYGLARPV